MKKTILLLSVIASITSLANVFGEVVVDAKNTNTFGNYKDKSFTQKEYNIDYVDTGVHVNYNNMLYFGADISGNDVKLPKDKKAKDKFFESSRVYLEYAAGNNSVFANVKGDEFQIGYSTSQNNEKYGINYGNITALEIPYNIKIKEAAKYLKIKNINHVEYANENTAVKTKVIMEKNFTGPIKDANNQNKLTHHSIEYIFEKTDTTHKFMNGKLTIRGFNELQYAINKKEISFYDELRDIRNIGIKSFSDEGNAVVKKMEQKYLFEVYGNPTSNSILYSTLFLQNHCVDEKDNTVTVTPGSTANDEKIKPNFITTFGAKINMQYSGVKNLKLDAKAVLGGGFDIQDIKSISKLSDIANGKYNLYGFTSIESGVKYTVNLQKINIIPELRAKGTFDRLHKSDTHYKFAKNASNLVTFDIEPKLTINYTPIRNLELSTTLGLNTKFSNVVYKDDEANAYQKETSYNVEKKKFGFSSINPNIRLYLKYNWNVK